MFPKALRREILLLLAIKGLLLATLYFAFFAPDHRPVITPGQLRAHLLGTG